MKRPSMMYAELLRESRLDDRVKLESILSVALNLRPAALVYFDDLVGPPEETAQRFKEHEAKYGLTRDVLIKKFRQEMSHLADYIANSKKGQSYALAGAMDKLKEIIEQEKQRDARFVVTMHRESPEYKTCLEWIGRFGLRMKEISKAEIIVYDPSVERKVKLCSPTTSQGMKIRGGILGYPHCCTDAFIRDRKNSTSVEQRGSSQLEECETSPLAYFVREFWPCHPTCKKATQIGERFYQAFESMGVGENYRRLLNENLEEARDYQDFARKQIERAYRPEVEEFEREAYKILQEFQETLASKMRRS